MILLELSSNINIKHFVVVVLSSVTNGTRTSNWLFLSLKGDTLNFDSVDFVVLVLR